MSSPADGDHGPEGYRRERHFARQCALQFLYQADLQRDWGNVSRNLAHLRRQVRELGTVPEGIDFEQAWAFADGLARGACVKRFALDRYIAEAATNWTIARMSPVDRNILRLATYEMHFAGCTPPVTAVDEGVELAKEFGNADSKRFVNGVLDRILNLLREGHSDDTSSPPAAEPAAPETDSETEHVD